MAGCYGGSAEDRYFENMLMRHLSDEGEMEEDEADDQAYTEDEPVLCDCGRMTTEEIYIHNDGMCNTCYDENKGKPVKIFMVKGMVNVPVRFWDRKIAENKEEARKLYEQGYIRDKDGDKYWKQSGQSDCEVRRNICPK